MDIKVYKRPGCGWCVKLDEVMNRAGIKQENIETFIVGKDITNDEFKEKFPSAIGVPYTIIDEEELPGVPDVVKYFVDKGILSSRKTNGN